MFGVGTAFPHVFFYQYIPVCQQQFLDKSSAHHENRCFLSINVLLCLIICFQLAV